MKTINEVRKIGSTSQIFRAAVPTQSSSQTRGRRCPVTGLKTRLVEGLIQDKFIMIQIPPIGMVWELGEGCTNPGVFVTRPWLKITRSVASGLRTTLECGVNKRSPTYSHIFRNGKLLESVRFEDLKQQPLTLWIFWGAAVL
ncbi:hypothetical protein TNCV_2728671 [Trichonephila clavipes]|nr:hypothetical protein TNCV_2728671 [Trichonephila clavipes]